MYADKYKEKLKTSLIHKEEQISVAYYNAQKLMQTVLDENPSIAATISKMSFAGLLVGGVFSIKYNDTKVNSTKNLSADTTDEIEDILHQSIRKYESDVVISISKRVDVSEVYNNFMVAYQGFYSNLISMECRQQIVLGSRRITAQFVFNYRIGRVKLNMMETAVNKKVADLGRTLFCDGMSDVVKAFIAHNYLAKSVTYWLKDDAVPLEESYMQSAYGALINQKCVCQGYAEAYKRILDSQNIICEVICGKIRGSTEHHAWNVISFNGKDYYHVDVTWDSNKMGSSKYKYYGLKDSELQADRIWTRISKIICNAKENILEAAQSELAKKGKIFAFCGADKKYFN